MTDDQKPRPLGTDQQGRYPEAAHAASEYDIDAEEQHESGAAGLVLWLALGWIVVAGLWVVFS